MQQSHSPLFELGESNIFEEFYELIEKHRLNTSRKFSIEDMYNNLSKFDFAYQQFSTKNNSKSNSIVYSYLNHCLYCFLIPFKFNGFSDRPFYWAFNRFIQFSTLLLEHSNGIDNPSFYYRNISQNFPSLWHGPYIDILRNNNFNFNIYSVDQFEEYIPIFNNAEEEISRDLGITNRVRNTLDANFKIYRTNFEVIETTYKVLSNFFELGLISYEMEIKFNISNNDNDAQRLLHSLYLITTALSNIKNVRLEFEDLQIGSLVGKIRLYLKDLVAKEETKAVLETTKETVFKTLSGGTVSHTETKKTNAETQKTIKETELLNKELEDRPSNVEAKFATALNLEKQALENEKLRIQNAKEKLEIIEKLSDLASKGILEADMLKIDINGFLYLIKDQNQIESSNLNIDDIA